MSTIGTLEEWRAYATARGNPAPAEADDVPANAALVRATDYIRHHYVAQFLPGYDESLPIVESAVYEAANFELETPGFFSQTFTPAQQKVLTRAGDIQWTVSGGTDSRDAWANASPTSTRIAAMLAPYMPGKYRVGLRAVGP